MCVLVGGCNLRLYLYLMNDLIVYLLHISLFSKAFAILSQPLNHISPEKAVGRSTVEQFYL